jgi:hypothetical protein
MAAVPSIALAFTRLVALGPVYGLTARIDAIGPFPWKSEHRRRAVLPNASSF